MDQYKELKERLDILMSDARIFRDEMHEEVAKLKVNQHKIEEKLTAMENIVSQMRLLGVRAIGR